MSVRLSARLSVRSATLVLTASALAVGGAVVAGAPASAAPAVKHIVAPLSGLQEVPGPGDADGKGKGTLDVNATTGEICYVLEVRGIAPATAAHIHEAARGVAAGVVQVLKPPTSGRSSSCVTNLKVARGIVEAPADYYLNVHNLDFPGGAVRGQLPGRP